MNWANQIDSRSHEASLSHVGTYLPIHTKHKDAIIGGKYKEMQQDVYRYTKTTSWVQRCSCRKRHGRSAPCRQQ